MNAPAPKIILVHPQMGENIGAAARAMANFGLEELRLVSPRDSWPNQAAANMAAGALDHISPVKIHDTVKSALADCHYVYATTARRRDMTKPVMDLATAALEIKQRACKKQHVALVFGPERTGLSNDDLALCQGLIHIPVNPDFSSINLGQAVLLACYQWAISAVEDSGKILETGDSRPVRQKKLEEFFDRLISILENRHFFRSEDMKPSMIRNIRNIFIRAELTDQETQTLHGMLSALEGKKTPPL